MKLRSLLFIVLSFFCLEIYGAELSNPDSVNVIKLEMSDYGLIFTTIEVNGEQLKAMIDFGDPNLLQLSSSFVEKEGLKVENSDEQVMDVYGNKFTIEKGVVSSVIIGSWKHQQVAFSSSPGEMESVAEQIGTDFNAVVGWGYFSKYFTSIDYSEGVFEIRKKAPKPESIYLTTTCNRSANYLMIPIKVANKSFQFIIDTGSPTSVADSAVFNKLDMKSLKCSIANKPIDMKLQTMDLSVLEPLGAAGIIGGDVISQYKIHINPFEHTLVFE